jgi:hypothetical protein
VAKGVGELIDGVASAVDHQLLQQEAVHLVFEVDVLDRDAGGPQSLRVGASFIA